MGSPVDRTARSFGRIAALAGLAAAVAIILLVAYGLRAASHRDRSVANLKRIGAAMQVYHEKHKHFPADLRGGDGEAILSWRVRILPLMGYNSLFREFRLDEPWDGPHNRPLLARMPAVYALPDGSAGPGMTFYRGFSGKDTLFDPRFPEGVEIARITDGTAITIAVVEAREAVPWTRPDSEIPYTDEFRAVEPHQPLLGKSRHLVEQFHGKIEEPEGLKPLRAALGGHFNALFCDGSVKPLSDSIDVVLLRALITRDQGENTSADAY